MLTCDIKKEFKGQRHHKPNIPIMMSQWKGPAAIFEKASTIPPTLIV